MNASPCADAEEATAVLRLETAAPRIRAFTIFGPDGLETLALPLGAELVLGRSSSCDVRIYSATVSRRHAVVRVGGEVALEDLGSHNGTFVAGRRLRPGDPIGVPPGVAIRFGDVSASLLDGAAAADLELDHDPGRTPAMRAVDAMIARLAVGTISVLVAGETGVGKERVAARIHELSPRRRRPFMKLNCAAFTETLLESELFGHEKGAFTGAMQARPGLLEAASGGTLFLDEVGEMSLPAQAKLLRCLEHGEVLPVGAIRARTIDVRFVAATNRDLLREVRAGRFREDLYYRIAGATIEVPPLRERRGEILALAAEFAADAARRLGELAAPPLSPRAAALLLEHPWPGNIRELRNTVERAVLLCGGDPIEAGHLPPTALTVRTAIPTANEHDRIRRALEEAGGNQTVAAQLLGMSRVTLLRRLDRLGIPRPRKRPG